MSFIHCGDNLEFMRRLPSEYVDLIYLDPPYFTQKNFGEFNDVWGSLSDYIEFMRVRLVECHHILKNTGSIYIHVDWHAAHYLKVEMDRIFGYNNFQNEIIWAYKSGGVPKNAFARKHDNILFYSKSDKNTFNTMKDNRLPEELINYPEEDENGKFTWWARPGSKSGGPNGKKIYFDEGTIMRDVWEIPILNQMSKERLGYPTQKPEELLERIIKASSNEGDVVFDPFCGCGTSVAVANRLGRRYIGIDVSPVACRLTEERISH